jgi:hypothetical protein
MLQSSLGMHLLLIPDDSAMHIPAPAREDVATAIATSAAMCDVLAREKAVCEDHIHILIEITDEEQAARFIAKTIDSVTEIVAAYHPGFIINDRIHVTLLPAAHVEIMSSFLRDQERYHAEHSLEEELNGIFRPSMVHEGVVN